MNRYGDIGTSERVKNSIALLDEKGPKNWRAELVKQRERFNVTSNCDCVLAIIFDPTRERVGQHPSGYGLGRKELRVDAEATKKHGNANGIFAFSGVDAEDIPNPVSCSTYQDMERVWNQHIDIWEAELTQGVTDE